MSKSLAPTSPKRGPKGLCEGGGGAVSAENEKRKPSYLKSKRVIFVLLFTKHNS